MPFQDPNEFVSGIPATGGVLENPVVEFPSQPALAPSPVIPGSEVQRATAIQATGGLPKPPSEGPSTWQRIAAIAAMLGQAAGDIHRPPGQKVGAAGIMKVGQDIAAQWRETADRQAMAYLVQLRSLSMTEPTKASAALEDFMGRASAAGATGALSPQVMNMALQLQTELRRGQVVPGLLRALPGDTTSPRLNFLRGALTNMGPDAFLHLDEIMKITNVIPETSVPEYALKGTPEQGIWAINPKNPFTDKMQIVAPGTDLNQGEFLRLGVDSVGGKLLKSGRDPNTLWRDLNSTDMATKAQAMTEIAKGLVQEQKDRSLSTTGFGQEVNTALGRLAVNPLEVHDAMTSGDPARQVWAASLLEDIAKSQGVRKEMERRATATATAMAQLDVLKKTPIGMVFKEKAHQWVEKEALIGAKAQAGGRPVLKQLDVGTEFEQATRKGVNLSDEQFTAIKTAQSAMATLDDFERTFEQVFTTNNKFVAAYRAGKMTLSQFVDSNPGAAQLKAHGAGLFQLATSLGTGSARYISDKDMAIISGTAKLDFLQTNQNAKIRVATIRRSLLNAERIAVGLDPLAPPPLVKSLPGTIERY